MATVDIYFLFGLFALIVSIITVIGHCLTINAFLNVRSLTANSSNLLILALSITDLIFGVFVFVYYGVPITFGLGNPFGEIGCLLSVPLDASYVTGNLLLVAISTDRVLLVYKDYSKYMKMQSKKRIKLTVIICFGGGLVVSIIEIGLWNYAKRNNEAAANIDFNEYCLYPPRRMKWFSLYMTFGVYCLPVFVVGILSGVFLVLLRGRIRKTTQVGTTRSTIQQNVSTSGGAIAAEGSSSATGDEEGSVVKKRYLKPAITLGALVTAMAISTLPYCIYLVVEAYSTKANNYDLVFIMWLIYSLNPMLDSVFYAATQRSIREYYWKKYMNIYDKFRRQ